MVLVQMEARRQAEQCMMLTSDIFARWTPTSLGRLPHPAAKVISTIGNYHIAWVRYDQFSKLLLFSGLCMLPA